MNRCAWNLLLICTVISLVGCRNCGPVCNSCAGNSLIAPPGTNSLQIPSVANTQPYYNAQNRQAALVNPNQNAPTPATNGTGWQAQGSNNINLTPANSNPNNAGANLTQPGMRSIVEGGTGRPQVNPTSFTSRTASAANGISYRDSVNYQSTLIDERRDDTRLPVTDASRVRAPAPIYSQATGNRLAQLPINQTIQGQLSPQPRYFGQLTAVPNTSNFPQNNVAQAQFTTPAPQNAVLAQSTATYDPQSNPNYQAGWRDRDLTERRR